MITIDLQQSVLVGVPRRGWPNINMITWNDAQSMSVFLIFNGYFYRDNKDNVRRGLPGIGTIAALEANFRNNYEVQEGVTGLDLLYV